MPVILTRYWAVRPANLGTNIGLVALSAYDGPERRSTSLILIGCINYSSLKVLFHEYLHVGTRRGFGGSRKGQVQGDEGPKLREGFEASAGSWS